MVHIKNIYFTFFLLAATFISVTPHPEETPLHSADAKPKLSLSERNGDLILSSTTQSNGTIVYASQGPIKRCRNQSAERDPLNHCLRLILADLKPRLAGGIPEINLPPMDPLRLNNIGFQHRTGPIKIVANFTNVNTTGLSKYNQSNFTIDMERQILNFDMGIPQMQIVGNYDLSGNLFFFPIGGKGDFWVHLIGVSSKGKGNLKIEQINGQRAFQLRSSDLDFSIQGTKVHLTNLFNGDKLLGSVMNNFLNENSNEILTELRPQIARRIGDMMKLFTNKALVGLSSEYFAEFPESVTSGSEPSKAS